MNPSNHPASAEAAKQRLLVVDDHRDTADLTVRVLKLYGYTATTAYDYDEAVALCAAQHFDLIFTDLELGEPRNGIQLFVQLHDAYGIKGIAYSGHGMPENIQAATDAGFSDYILKPAAVQILLASIAKVLGVAEPVDRPANAYQPSNSPRAAS